ncbi:cytochrome c oxidase assembly protein [Leifsonia sp. ZF2019]|uniref:cytochrome c oxidase assembly protein n=1 Tax=Leifsonia sp. ZF2019 TaxID=2781978 RepID=UPI001CC045ED|nr:cytochrome c oxidase assembly protein [Leifsonia sp. ZF2019]UAJ78901.1 cytochrome c oxidase assembly protein [Leifsonia sp. ZF2019]
MSGPMWMPTAPPTLARLVALHPQPVPVIPVLMLVLAGLYTAGVVLLLRRGDRWPVSSAVFWALGILSVLAMTATGIDGYGMELFSVHMVQHMVLSMLAPIFLVLGAPITLALRALPARPAGTFSARSLLLSVLHSAPARFVAHPATALVLFLGSLYGLYFTPAFDGLMSTMWGHNLMLLHFVAIGFLYFWCVLGVDPTPRRASRGLRKYAAPTVRILELAATAPFHAFFGVMLMMSVALVVGFYRIPISGWGIAPLADQAVGGGIAWGFTELPTVFVLGVLLLQWQRSDERTTRRRERSAARAEAERRSYNDYLQRLAARDREGTR